MLIPVSEDTLTGSAPLGQGPSCNQDLPLYEALQTSGTGVDATTVVITKWFASVGYELKPPGYELKPLRYELKLE